MALPRLTVLVGAALPASLATGIVLIGGSEPIREGQYLSGLGVGFLGTLYTATVVLMGLATKRNRVVTAGLIGFVASIAIYGMNYVSSIPMFDGGQ